MHKQDIVIIGAGSMTLELIDFIGDLNKVNHNKIEVTDVLHDDSESSKTNDIKKLFNINFNEVKSFDEIEKIETKKFIISIADTRAKEKYLKKLTSANLKLISIIHPSAHVSTNAKLGEGLIISPLSYIGANSIIEDNSIINANCTVGHDVHLGPSSICSPGTRLLGGSKIGKCVFFGTNCIVHPRNQIGNYCRISLGCIVLKDIRAGSLVHGNPIKVMRFYNPANGKSLFGEGNI